MSAPPGLRRAQELFWTLITAPEGVRPAVAGLRERGGATEREIRALFAEGPGIDALDRVDVYANMYFFRLLDALREDYPKTRSALGAARFHNLVTDYLLAHPSRHPSLRHLGRHLPRFLDGHALAGEFPFAPDLARLEWDRVEAFDAADAAPATRADLARLAPESAGAARLTFVPAFAFRRAAHDVARLWRVLDAAGEGDDPAAVPGAAIGRASAVRVWRRDLAVFHLAVDDEEAGCLESALAGASLERLCRAVAAGRSVARATARVGRMIERWLEDGIVASCAPPARQAAEKE